MATQASAGPNGTSQSLGVVIVGGSLAGLMYGIVLVRAGHRVTILERSSGYSSGSGQAAGITMSTHILAFMAQYDRCADESIALPCDGMQFIDAQGQRRRFHPYASGTTSWGSLYARLRQNFDGYAGGDAAPLPGSKAVYRCDAVVVRLMYEPDGVTVEWQSPPSASRDPPIQRITADLVIGADGAHSLVKRSLFGHRDLARNRADYAGYVAWRGTVREADVSATATTLFKGHLSSFVHPGGYILVYHIPNGTDRRPGCGLLNFVWYSIQPLAALQQILTDTAGVRHRRSLGPGQLRPDIWAEQQIIAERVMPEAYRELIRHVKEPFVQVIQDSFAPAALAGPDTPANGRVLLAGEALIALRPHQAQGVNQIARGALLLAEVAKGQRSLSGAATALHAEVGAVRWSSIALGEFLLYGIVRASYALVIFGWVSLKGRLRKLWAPTTPKGFDHLMGRPKLE